MKLRHTFAVVGLALFGTTALAGEGVLEINQACAVDGGCFSGDGAGFPIEITNSGSYRLTSDLDVTEADDAPNTDGILVNVSDVSLDLNGFSISGPVSCDSTPATSCSNTGSGNGVSVDFSANPTPQDVTLRNGTIRGMGNNGIGLPEGSRVINVHAVENGDVGMRIDSSGSIRDIVARRNGSSGIHIGPSSTAVNIHSAGNGHDGASVGEDSLISHSAFLQNRAHGVFGSTNITVRDSAISGNGFAGVDLSSGNSVLDSEVNNNGGAGVTGGNQMIIENTASRGNASHGIIVGQGSVIRGGQVSNNGADGINATAQITIENTVSENNANGGMDVSQGSVIRGSVAALNGVNGIFLRGGDSLVIDSTAVNNGSGLGGDDGIDCDLGTSGIKGNVMAGNDGQPFRGCIKLGENICNGSLCTF